MCRTPGSYRDRENGIHLIFFFCFRYGFYIWIAVFFFLLQYCPLSGSWSQLSSSVLGESFHLAPFSLKCKSCCWYVVRWTLQQVTLIIISLFRYFIFTSFWAYKIYYVYGFMMLVLVILCIVTVCVTIVCTYFLLNAEDYRWWVQPWNKMSAEEHMGCELHDFVFSLPGNGQASFLLHLLLFMFTCTPFTTTSLKLSELQISSSSYEKIISLSGLKMHYNM